MRRKRTGTTTPASTCKGKTVVMLINDPGFHDNDAGAVRGPAHDLLRALDLQVRGSRAPGRRRGASSSTTRAGAGYGWDVVKNSWSGAQFDLLASRRPGAAAAAAGLDRPAMSARDAVRARRPGPGDAARRRRQARLQGRAARRCAASTRRCTARSARVELAQRGRAPAGQQASRTRRSSTWRTGTTWARMPTKPGDNIYNGAIDNAHRRRRRARDRRAVHRAEPEARAQHRVPAGDAGRIRPARLGLLRRAPGACRWPTRWRWSTSTRCRWSA